MQVCLRSLCVGVAPKTLNVSGRVLLKNREPFTINSDKLALRFLRTSQRRRPDSMYSESGK